MAKPTITVFIDRYHPKRDGACSVSICVSHQRKRRFYPTGKSMNPEEFETLMNAKRRSAEQTKFYNKILAFESRAVEVADKLDVFTFAMFEDMYLSNKDATNSIAYGFDQYIAQLRKEGRISTAITFECALNSLNEYKPDLRYADITPSMLKEYQTWMTSPQKVKRKWRGMDHSVDVKRKPLSKSTVGIYLRSLRAVMNRAKIDPALYPFSKNREKGKFVIPTSRNIKKALKPDQITRIYNYPTQPGTPEDMAKDFWFFMYLCNGMNLKDVGLLKWKNKNGDTLRFVRAKTINTKLEENEIEVHLKPMAKAIIAKYGQPSIDPNAYIFPFFRKNSSPEEIRKTVQQINQNFNKSMKRIAKAVGIDRQVTTYFARHSFATILKNAGANVVLISNSLGHATVSQTQKYLDGFEKEEIEQATDALTAFLPMR